MRQAVVLSDVSFEGSAIIRAGRSTHPLLQATPNMGRTRWILILCAWTIVGLLFAVRRVVLANVQGTHVSWVMGALELVWWYVWAAYTPLVIGLAKRFPLTGPKVVPIYEFYWHAYVLVSCGTVSVDPLLPGRYGAPD